MRNWHDLHLFLFFYYFSFRLLHSLHPYTHPKIAIEWKPFKCCMKLNKKKIEVRARVMFTQNNQMSWTSALSSCILSLTDRSVVVPVFWFRNINLFQFGWEVVKIAWSKRNDVRDMRHECMTFEALRDRRRLNFATLVITIKFITLPMLAAHARIYSVQYQQVRVIIEATTTKTSAFFSNLLLSAENINRRTFSYVRVMYD